MAIKETGIEHLRAVVAAFNNCRESFLDPFTPEQLLKLHDAWTATAWDFRPDQWSERQVREALRGVVPQWNAGGEEPVYTRARKAKAAS